MLPMALLKLLNSLEDISMKKEGKKKLFGGMTAQQRRNKQNWLDIENRLSAHSLTDEQKQQVLDKFNTLFK